MEKNVVLKLRQEVKVKVDTVTGDDIKIYYTGKFQDFTARYIIKFSNSSKYDVITSAAGFYVVTLVFEYFNSIICIFTVSPQSIHSVFNCVLSLMGYVPF